LGKAPGRREAKHGNSRQFRRERVFAASFQSELACLKNHSDMPEGLLRLFRQGVETRNGFSRRQNGFSRRQTVVARPKAARIALPQPAPEGNRMQSRRIDERKGIDFQARQVSLALPDRRA